MKKVILIVMSCLFLTSCSLLPKVSFNTPNTVPQSIDKSKSKDICKGEAKFDETGKLIYCSKGYYSYSEDYNKKERKMTIIERIKSFINNLVGWSFWIFVALLIFCPSAIGFIVGRVIEGAIGIAKKSLTATVRAVQKVRTEGQDLNTALATEQDNDVKTYIAQVKKEEKLK